ncbi:MAG: Cys-Xaa-Xaa-Xaa repeat radical SAM target protein [Muribaculaceae bacterium]|nr:Cys-Xaa-Xaa-Xaa repeat radical SAM target protein [Muribaculaceae bacterium]
MKDKRNEELQSRRQFFKKAAKSALPILGAIAIANMPMIAKAAQADRCYAGYACSGGCSGDCKGSCKYGCSSCSGGCKGTCRSSSGR